MRVGRLTAVSVTRFCREGSGHKTLCAEHHFLNGRAMVQAVNRRPVTAEARVRSLVSPCGICGEQSGTGTGFSPSTLDFPSQFHSTGAPLLGEMKKLIIIFLFITGLYNKPQGCGASVASAAGPFCTHTQNSTLKEQAKQRGVPSLDKTLCLFNHPGLNTFHP
jgi:hypothetical protein